MLQIRCEAEFLHAEGNKVVNLVLNEAYVIYNVIALGRLKCEAVCVGVLLTFAI